jgi:Uma2 family endonuclease
MRMSAAPTIKLTPAEYLAIERKAEFKSEYYAGEMFAMAGASRQHSRARTNLSGELHGQLKESSCEIYDQDMRLRVSPTGLYTYPDIAIVCGKAEFEDTELDILLNPRAIFEVLSESTEKYDRGTKFEHYRQISSLQEYVLVSQDRPRVERFVRQADDSWKFVEISGMDATLEFTSVPARVALAEIYRGVEFPEPKLR